MSQSSNKVLLLGDTGVGKSTLVNTLCGKADSRPESTVGVSIKVGSCFILLLMFRYKNWKLVNMFPL